MTSSFSKGPAPFLPTSIYLPNDMSQMLLRLQAYLIEISLKLNVREIALYENDELLTGQIWPPETGAVRESAGFRKIYRFGPIAAGANLLIPLGTDGVSSYTHIYGTVKTDAPDDRPIPYADEAVVTNQISLKVNAGNVEIFVGATSPNVLSGTVILEYLKN